MNVEDIPVPAMATIRVSKEGKSAVFETTVIQTTDNKYIYNVDMPDFKRGKHTIDVYIGNTRIAENL